MSALKLRHIQESDNPIIAKVIRSILEEHEMARPGTVYTDPTTDNLFELFSIDKAVYWIVTENEEIVGGCGIYPTKGLPENCAELVKLYLLPSARNQGMGKKLLMQCAEDAKSLGYSKLYLESMPELNAAVGLYERVGYEKISAPLGDSGHFACNLWMLKTLD